MSTDKGASGSTYVEKYDTRDAQDVIDPQLEKKVVHRLDRRIMPLLFGLWLLAFIDRSNIGNARIDGLATDLKLTGKW